MKNLFTRLFIFTILTSLFALQSHAALPPALLPQTGQTLCYNSVGTVIPCAGSGQDGELQNGLQWPTPRFVDNGDQTQTDNLTGLIWSKNANSAGATKTWQQALDYVKTLNSSSYLGYNDWRLPNSNELASLVSNGQANSTTWLNGQGFSNVQSSYYWSATNYANFTGGAWVIYMDYGFVGYDLKRYDDGYVWPVRSGQSGGALELPKTGQTDCYNVTGSTITCSGTGQNGELQTGVTWPTPRFVDNIDQTQTDNLTGLMWGKNANSAGATKTWQQALDYIKTLNSSNYLGYNDWRLPNSNELASLVNKGQANSDTWLNGQGFSNVQSDGYWSATTYAYGTGSAWVVYMDGGGVVNEYKTGYYGSYYVWPVRSGQFWTFGSLILSASPNFGTVHTDTPPPARQIEIGNRGATAQSITSIAIIGTNSAEFSITNGGSTPCGSLNPTLAAGASCTLMLGFSPASNGAMSASLDITANGTTNSIALSGTAISTVYGAVTDQSTGLPVSGATVTLNTPATAITDSNGNYTFGNLTAATYSITISKTGYQPITRSGLVVTATTSVNADILFPTVGTLNITSTSLLWASPNLPYSNRVMVAGGTAPYTFSKPYGALPVGLTLDTTTGTIGGTPTGTGSYTFAIGVSDSVAGYSEKEFTIEVIVPLQITTASIPSGQQGVSYSSSILATGGKSAYSFTLTSGALPNGLNLATNGALYGTPRESGSFNITVRLSDSTGVTVDKSYALTLTTAAALAFNTTTLPQGYVGTYYSTTLSASGGVTPRTFSVIGILPTGLNLNSSTGEISGTPAVAGLTNLTFTVADYLYPSAQTASGVIPLRIWSAQNGVCGTSNGTTLTIIPSTNLCTTGMASTVTGSGPWNWTCAGTNGGTTADCSANKSISPQIMFTVTPIPGSSFTITPATLQTVTNNATTSFTVTPASGYGVVVSGCGGILSGTSYTTGPITANCTINVTAVARTAGSGGAAQPPTISDALKVLLAVVGTAPLTPEDRIRYDVAPLGSGGSPVGNGTIDAADVILILRRSIGIGSW